MSHVYSRPVVTVDDVKRGSLGSAQSPVRVTYFSSNDYKRAAKVGWDWLTAPQYSSLIGPGSGHHGRLQVRGAADGVPGHRELHAGGGEGVPRTQQELAGLRPQVVLAASLELRSVGR